MITQYLSLKTFSLRTIHLSSYVALLAAALAIPFGVTAQGGGFEPYYPANEQLRGTILGVVERQTLRPHPGLERLLRDALQSISAVEGRTDPRMARLLSARLKGTSTELERARAIGGLGYTEFDDETFQTAEAAFQEVLTQFVGARTPYPAEKYQAALQALADAQALSQNARRAVPGLSNDDVHLMQEKRWHSQWKTVVEENENPPLKESKVTPRRETAPSR